MSTVLSERNGVKSRRVKRCCLCGEHIHIGEIKDVRTGVDSGDMWTMHMHPECHAFEQKGWVKDWDWYEDVSEPAFDRSEAIAFAKLQEPTK